MNRTESEFDDFAELSTLLLTAWRAEPWNDRRWSTFANAIDDSLLRQRLRLAPIALVRE